MSSVMSEELRDVMSSLTGKRRLRRPAGPDCRDARGNQPAVAAFQGLLLKTAEIFLREVPDALIGTG